MFPEEFSHLQCLKESCLILLREFVAAASDSPSRCFNDTNAEGARQMCLPIGVPIKCQLNILAMMHESADHKPLRKCELTMLAAALASMNMSCRCR